MSVNTHAIISNSVTLDQLIDKLNKIGSDVKIHTTPVVSFIQISFVYRSSESRKMSVFFGDTALHDHEINGTLINLNYWGSSIEIMKDILNEFGGYIDENDCDSEGFYPVNIEKFNDGKMTLSQQAELEIMNKLGYDNLKIAKDIIKRYKCVF